MLFTLGKGNFVHLETIVRHVSRPRLPKEKRDAIAVNTARQLSSVLRSWLSCWRYIHIWAYMQARVLKILDRLKSVGLVTFQLEDDNKPETIGAIFESENC